MNKAMELKETVKFYEERIEFLEKQFETTDDIKFARYIRAEIEMLEETLDAVRDEYKRVCGLHKQVTQKS